MWSASKPDPSNYFDIQWGPNRLKRNGPIPPLLQILPSSVAPLLGTLLGASDELRLRILRVPAQDSFSVLSLHHL